MASAKINTRFTEKVVTKIEKVEVPDGVTLSLTDDEAKALVAVLRRVGGTPQDSRRGLCDSILEALKGADVPYGMGLDNDLAGRVTFEDR